MSPRGFSLFAAAAGLAALAGAAVAQYGFGLRPCVLCLAQRVPFALAVMAGAVTGLWSLGDTAQRRLAGLAGLAFAVNTALATYHVGVERHWWASAVCGRDTSEVADIGNLASALSKPAEVECDRPALVWHGLTMAGANIAYSGLLTAAAVMAARNWRRRR